MIPQFHPQYAAHSDILALLPPIAAEAAHAIHAKTRGADPGLIRTQMLAFMAAAAAPLYKVSMPEWEPIPLDVKVICIGRSGVGKSPIHRHLAKPFNDFAEKRTTSYQRECVDHTQSEALRKVHLEILQTEIKRKYKAGENVEEIERKLRAMSKPLPPPKERSRLASDLHFEKLVALLHGDNEAIDLLLTEGDELLNSLLIRRHAGAFNDLHDGTGRLEGPQQRRRPTRGTNASVSMLFLLRESALARHQPSEGDGKIVRSPLVDNGFFARGLVYFADQLPYQTGLYAPSDPDAAIMALNQRTFEMLEIHHAKLVAGDTTRIELQLAPDAEGFWHQIGDDIRHQRNSFHSLIDEFLGKMQSLTAKVAAILHAYESDSLIISLSALKRAWAIVTSHLAHYERAFVPPPPPSTKERDASALARLLRDLFYKDPGTRTISVTDCSVRLDISYRRALGAAYQLADLGQATVESGETIDFSKIMNFTPFVTRRL